MAIQITTASREPEGLAEAPARVQVVTAAQIERRGYRSILDVLKDLADFKVDLAGDPDYPAQLAVQGTPGASLVVLLLDGIRVSSPTNEPLPMMANYPVHNARQVEIVYGPVSALYGADAFSAVINIISKDVSESPGLAVGSSVGQFGLLQPDGVIRDPPWRERHLDALRSVSIRPPARSQPLLPRVWRDAGTAHWRVQHDLRADDVEPACFPRLRHSHVRAFTAGPVPLGRARPVAVPESASARRPRRPILPDNAVYNAAAFEQNNLLVASGSYTRTTPASHEHFHGDVQPPRIGSAVRLLESLQQYGKELQIRLWLDGEGGAAVLVEADIVDRDDCRRHLRALLSIPQGADLEAPVQSQDTPGTILNTNLPDLFVKLRYANTGAYIQMRYRLDAACDADARGPRRLQLPIRRHLQSPSWHGRATDRTHDAEGVLRHRLPGAFAISGVLTLRIVLFVRRRQDLHIRVLAPAKSGSQAAAETHRRGQRAAKAWTLLQFSGSVFYSRFSRLIRTYGPDGTVGAFYLGWPVDYIDYTVNQGHSVAYGTTLGLDYVRAFGPGRRLEAHAAAALADGRQWPRDDTQEGSAPTGAMAPVQLRFGVDLDWDRWRVAPRLSVSGAQRVLATIEAPGPLERRTLPGYSTVDLNVRRTCSGPSTCS